MKIGGDMSLVTSSMVTVNILVFGEALYAGICNSFSHLVSRLQVQVTHDRKSSTT